MPYIIYKSTIRTSTQQQSGRRKRTLLLSLRPFGQCKLSTSHDKKIEVGQGYVFGTSYTIRGHNHSHIYNNIPSPSDRKWAKDVNAKFLKAKLQILFKINYFEYD